MIDIVIIVVIFGVAAVDVVLLFVFSKKNKSNPRLIYY
jgi:hypothetical protein